MIIVYEVPLDVSLELAQEFERLLDTGEQEKAARFASQKLSTRYIAAHGALRLLLSAHIGIDPSTITFSTTGRSKPLVSEHICPGPLDFSLSHSGDVACIAVSTLGPVGVDVEEDRTIADLPQLLNSIISVKEQEELSGLTSQIPINQLALQCWTVKEAVLKAAGHGLYVAPTDVILNPGALRDLLSRRISSAIAQCPEESARVESTTFVTRWAVRPLTLPHAFAAIATQTDAANFEPDLQRLTVKDLQTRLSRSEKRYPPNDR